jgi:hypothetical protein
LVSSHKLGVAIVRAEPSTSPVKAGVSVGSKRHPRRSFWTTPPDKLRRNLVEGTWLRCRRLVSRQSPKLRPRPGVVRAFRSGNALLSALATAVSGGWSLGRTVRGGTLGVNTRRCRSFEIGIVSSVEELRLVPAVVPAGCAALQKSASAFRRFRSSNKIAKRCPYGVNAMEGVWVSHDGKVVEPQLVPSGSTC